MISKNILLTGANGKLGQELKHFLEVKPFKYDITKPFYTDDCDMIIHAAAYTETADAENNAWKCFNVNVIGTQNLVDTYFDVPFVYISSEYAKNPLGVYAMSKAMGESVVKAHPHHLIIRTLFKPDVWPWEYAYENQFTQGDSVSIIAKCIADVIKAWDGTSKTIYCGTGRKTMLELARRSKPDVKPNRVTNPIIPLDYI